VTKPVANPTRLSRLPESDDRLGVGRMFRNGRELPDEELPGLRWRVRTSQHLRTVRPRLFLKVALVVGIAFCTGGVVGAAVWSFWPRQVRDVVVDPKPAPASSARRVRARSVRPAPTPPAPVEPVSHDSKLASEPAPVATPTKHRPRVQVAMLAEPTSQPAAQTAPEAEPTPVAPSAIAAEQSLLAQVMGMLRGDRDARGALALLAQHAQRFPDGALASEATMLRIEALLALGRRDEALSLLDRAPLASLPNRDEHLVVRGELRAADGRWREARQDFDQALRDRALPAASAKARVMQERALWGRASARSRLGDQDGARADLELYLRHFPSGHFAEPATSLLKGAP
jgi:hypothetical protein